MRLFLALIAAFFWLALPLAAEEPAERLLRAMKVQETLTILADEGRAQGQQLGESLLDGVGIDYLSSQIAEMYDPVWMRRLIAHSVTNRMSDSQIEQAAIFFESELGQTIVSLENSARLAMTDDAIDEMARQSYAQADRDSSLYRLVDEYVSVNDLIEQNVRTSFNSDYAFIRGLATGQGGSTGNDALLGSLLSRGEEAEEETVEWIYSFLILAYRPLTETQLRENIAFSRTEAGRALNKSLFGAYDKMMVEITFNLGEAVAHAMQASDL